MDTDRQKFLATHFDSFSKGKNISGDQKQYKNGAEAEKPFKEIVMLFSTPVSITKKAENERDQ